MYVVYIHTIEKIPSRRTAEKIYKVQSPNACKKKKIVQ